MVTVLFLYGSYSVPPRSKIGMPLFENCAGNAHQTVGKILVEIRLGRNFAWTGNKPEIVAPNFTVLNHTRPTTAVWHLQTKVGTYHSSHMACLAMLLLVKIIYNGWKTGLLLYQST